MAGSESRFPSPKFNFKRSKTGISNQNVSKVELNLLKAVLGSELHKIWRNFFTAYIPNCDKNYITFIKITNIA